MSGKAPLGARILAGKTTDWEEFTDDQVIAARHRTNRLRSSRAMRVVTGFPDRRARIEERVLDLPGRSLALRMHRPVDAGPRLPLVLSFHGGGFLVGNAAQNDWLNSHLAARCPAVVVGVEYRLAPEHPLPLPIEDGHDVLVRILDEAGAWGVDPAAVAVLGESAGGTIAALLALRSRRGGPPVHAQVLTYPVVDWTTGMADYPSVTANTGQPGFSLSEWRTAARLGLPPGLDPRSVSPLKSEDLSGLPPALVVTGGLDPLDDHGGRYAERLLAAGTDARRVRYPRAVHGFVSMPGLVPDARPARREILAFLRGRLHPVDRRAGVGRR